MIFLGLLIMAINLNTYLNPMHAELFQATDRRVIVYGGMAAGKSYSIADKLLVRTCIEKNLKMLIIRKTFPSLRASCMDILSLRAMEMGIPYHYNAQRAEAIVGNNCKMLFNSINNSEDVNKLLSVTNLDACWMEEATDLTLDKYKIIKGRMRGGCGKYTQMLFSFNPVGKFKWVYPHFFESNVEKARRIKYTIEDNQPLLSTENGQEFVEELRATKDWDYNYYKVFYLGEWGDLSGLIYPNWEIKPSIPDNYDEIFYGLDFGFSVDPTALVRVYRKADEYYVKEIIYDRKLTHRDLAEKMVDLGIEKDKYIYADHEPSGIEEINRQGFNVHEALKGKDSVISGIDYLRSLKIYIVDGSENIIREQKSYVRKKDADGNERKEPIECFDHMMDAIRYAIVTHNNTKRSHMALADVVGVYEY
jgi:phage terminase large subunit